MPSKIADTILQQLGGPRFTFMTGARDYVGKDNPDGTGFLQMRLPSIRRSIRIILTANDTYTLELFSIVGGYYKLHDQRTGIYVEQLRDTFTRLTGLYTNL